MSLLSVETQLIPPSLPESLTPFTFSGTQLVKGTFPREVRLIKRPYFLISDSDINKEILTTWNTWWFATEWACNPTAQNPNWDAPSRSGQVWNRFGEAASTQNGHPYVYCFNCGLVLQHPAVRSCGTKHLIRHLSSSTCRETEVPIHSHPNLPPSLYTPLQGRQNKLTTIVPYSALAFETEIVRLVIDNNFSFRTIERPSFQRFIQFLRPEAVIISRYKFRRVFEAQFDAAEKALLQNLHGNTKLSIALDAWTAGNHLSFLAIKGYFISKMWKPQEVLLDFIPMRGKHTGVSMAQQVIRLLKATKTTNRLLAITCDNASNNSALSRTLQSQLQLEDITWNSKENTIPCLAHIINLVVQDIIHHLKLEATPETENAERLQQRHIRGIEAQMSVPNSLRKV
jgi:hypothetical protein